MWVGFVCIGLGYLETSPFSYGFYIDCTRDNIFQMGKNPMETTTVTGIGLPFIVDTSRKPT